LDTAAHYLNRRRGYREYHHRGSNIQGFVVGMEKGLYVLYIEREWKISRIYVVFILPIVRRG
jgi:hypothetical protein